MAYLHLPEQHSTGDLALAGQIAEALASQELFVVWTHEHGPGARPTVQAIVRDAPPTPVADALRALRAAICGAWRALIGAPAPARRQPARRRHQTA